MDELITVLETVFGSQVRSDARGIHAVVRSGDAFVPTRIRTSPVAELFATTRALDGFALSIRWANPDALELQGDAAFEAAFSFDTNDRMLAGMFVDGVSRRALLDSIHEYQSDELSLGSSTVRRTWTYELAHDEIAATKGGAENRADRIAKTLACACALAARSTRWAAEYAAIARELGGGTTRSEVDLGGPPVFTISRNAVDVELRLLRRSPGVSHEHLRTVISAKRVAPDATTVSLYDAEVAKGSLPPLPGSKRSIELAGYKLRASDEPTLVDEQAKKLVAIARPAAAIADADSIDVWFEGAPMQRERLDAAIELAARWAVGGGATSGPYR